MTTAATHIKKLLNLKFFDGYLGLIEPIETLIKERDEVQGTINGLKQLLELPESAGLIELFNAVESLELERDELKRTTIIEERDELQGTINNLEQLLELNKPQLSEIRYVLHGDIQPCSVLYSDETTTLLRLDEGDMMLETDTIEWSDSVTYRCQELLKGESKRSNIPVTLSPVKLFAQLVRDERILLNDNGDDEVVEQATAVVPAPPPFGREKPDHNNPYTHTNDLFTEKAMRDFGWTSESLVSCGHGHYVPMQHPVDTVEWTSSNSPTPLR